MLIFVSQVPGIQWAFRLIEKVKAVHNRISDHMNLFLNFLDHLGLPWWLRR